MAKASDTLLTPEMIASGWTMVEDYLSKTNSCDAIARIHPVKRDIQNAPDWAEIVFVVKLHDGVPTELQFYGEQPKKWTGGQQTYVLAEAVKIAEDYLDRGFLK